MKSQEYFFNLTTQKSTNKVLKRNILTSGKFISQKILRVISQFKKVTTDYKSHPLTNQASERALGPGRYHTPNPPSGHKYTFPKSPRFDQDSFTHLINSDSVLKSNQTVITYKLPKIPEDPKAKKLKDRLTRETKRIIESEKKEKLLKSLKDKVQKAEYRKNAIIKDSICKIFCVIFTHFTILRVLKDNLKIMALRRFHANSVLRKLIVLCKALGKFLLVASSYRKSKAIKRIKLLIPIRLKFWLNRHKKKLKMRLSASFDNYMTVILIRMFKARLMNACNLVQFRIKKFLNIMKGRKLALDLFWVKLNRYKILAPVHIRGYYINTYIKEKLKKHYYEKFKDKKLIYLLNERRHEEFIDEFYHEKGKTKPFLRFFIKNDLIDLIRLANSAIGTWRAIRPEKLKKVSKPKKRAKKKVTLKLSLSPSPLKETRKKK